MDRRSFVTTAGASAAGLAVASSSLERLVEAMVGRRTAEYFVPGFGELLPTPTRNTGETFLALPKGFEYNVIGKVKSEMSDGRPTPSRHDGQWTFKVGRELRIVRNHEVSNSSLPVPNAGIGTANHYDETCGGGTTTLVIDPKKKEIVRDFVSLSGTLINCSGGPTPWNSWISCEETTLGPTVRTNSSTGRKTGGFLKPHGYCFEVQASANNNLPPVALKAMGRFTHETVAVDRKTGVVYETEDLNPSGFYRFIPKRNKRLAEGGTLQMLAIEGKPEYDTRTGQRQGSVLPATWMTIDDPDPAHADVDPSAVFKQGKAKGGASFNRLEGSCMDDRGNVYFDATSGGDKRGGQIWRYEPMGRDRGNLRLLFESPSREILDMPDNMCLMPKSKLLFICEDSDYVGEGGTPDNYVRILTPEGKMANFAKNIVKGFERSEFAGSCFSNDGKIFFLNLYTIGATFAIWGDWSKFRS